MLILWFCFRDDTWKCLSLNEKILSCHFADILGLPSLYMWWAITDLMAMCTVIHGTYFYLTASESTAQIRVSSLGRRLNPNRLAPASRLPAARDATTTSSLRQHDVGDVAKKYRTQIVLIEQSVLATLCSITGVICLATMTFGRGVCFKAEFSCALSFATKW